MNAFNTMIDRHNSLIETTKAEQAAFNAGIDMHNAEVGTCSTECARKYCADDLAAARKLVEAS